MDEFTIYQAWPLYQVREALDEFKRQMYSGAGPDELGAGLRCFDFITRRTDLPRTLEVMIDAACNEARIRADLMRQADAINQEQGEALERIKQSLKHFQRSVDSIQRRLIDTPRDPEIVRAAVRRRVAAAQSASE